MIKFGHYPQFTTITCLNWLSILNNDYHKEIIIEALQKRVSENHVTIYAFVIMPNHMHLIWQLHDSVFSNIFQRDLLKFTARSLLAFLKMNDDPLYEQLKIVAADRKYQVWERNSLSIDLYSERVFMQKLHYIHNNPVKSKWALAPTPADYKYSSASFYETGVDEFKILTHYRG